MRDTALFFDTSLVSRGGSSGDKCYGDTGRNNICIHSGLIKTSGGLATTWYNYATASAGTVIGNSNTNTATESICSKGWTLPDKNQINSQRDVTSFSPVLGGTYWNGVLDGETRYGALWSSEMYNNVMRYFLRYKDDNLTTGDGSSRQNAIYIRCVLEST